MLALYLFSMVKNVMAILFLLKNGRCSGAMFADLYRSIRQVTSMEKMQRKNYEITYFFIIPAK